MSGRASPPSHGRTAFGAAALRGRWWYAWGTPRAVPIANASRFHPFALPVMSRASVLRAALWSSVGLNALGVAILVPLALGRPSPRWPMEAPPYYAAQLAYTIGLFGLVYAWLARQPVVSRPLLVVGALGKAGFFLLTLAYAVAGVVPRTLALQATPDLVLAVVFLWGARPSVPPGAGQATAV